MPIIISDKNEENLATYVAKTSNQHKLGKTKLSRQESDYHLIIKQSVLLADDLKSLSGTLFWESGIDANQSAQTITGSSFATLQKGIRQKLEKAAVVLDQSKIQNWLMPEARTIRYVPKKITGYSIDPSGIHFITQTREIGIENNDQIHIFIGDIKGEAVIQIKEDAGKKAALEQDKPSQAIIRRNRYKKLIANNAIADIYIFSPEGQFKGSARISPAGGISPSGDKKPEASEKLHEIISAIREKAGRLILNMEFGFARISGAYPSYGSGNDEIIENTDKLTKLGNLFVTMDQLKPFPDMKKDLAFLSESYAFISAPPPPIPDPAENIEAKSFETPNAAKSSAPSEDPFAWSNSGHLPPPPDEPTRNLDKKALAIVAFIGLYIFFMLAAKTGKSGFAAGIMDSLIKYCVETGLIFAVASVFLLWFGFRYITNKRLIENIPTSRARSVTMGMSELKGKAVRKYNLVSPISLAPCVYYSIEKFKKNSKGAWTRYASETRSSVPFYLEDETGRILIHPDGASLYGIRKDEYQSMFMMMGIGNATSMPIPPGEKWTEQIIAENSPIYVLGFVSPVAKGADSLKDRLLEKLRDLKQDKSSLMTYDANGDGKISPEEWDIARGEMEEEVLKDTLDGKHHGVEAADSIVLSKPKTPGMPMIIAPTRMEDKITKRFTMLGVASFAGAVVFAVTAIIYGIM